MTSYKIALYILSGLVIIATTLPLIRKDHWSFRIFDYPRLQKLTILGTTFALWIVFFYDTRLWIDLVIMGSLLVQFLFLLYVVLPYTALSKPMIARVADTGQEKITILVANVFQDNNDFAKLLALVELRDPDVIFLLETDQKWLKGVKSLKKTHPYFIEVPKDNTYGLLFYSKFPLHNVEVNYLIDKEIPSIVADVEFDDQQIRIYGLHPMPPVPQESEFSTSRDAEILLIGKEAKKHKGPCLVIGDLNDVAWSYSTTLFLKASGLLDPRRGRGVYSTFNANYKLLRWPLDHIFVSSHFRLISMNVEKHIGSDHFPICICLCVADKDESNKLTADQEDKKLVEEKIVAGLIDEPR